MKTTTRKAKPKGALRRAACNVIPALALSVGFSPASAVEHHVEASSSLSRAVSETCTAPAPPSGSNVVSPDERAQGWRLLWDGQSSDGWRSAGSDAFPVTGWTMCDGVLTINGHGGGESRGPGDIITRARYSDFEMVFDFQITPGANSGVKIFVQTDISPIDRVTGVPTPIGSGIGIEFQILDDDLHPDARLGRDGNRTIGSFYDVMPAPADKTVHPVGDWNHGRIVSQANSVTFYLNGIKTVEFTRGSPAFQAAVSQSKFKNITGFGEWADGHILLQDHGDRVFYTNLKIRPLPADQ